MLGVYLLTICFSGVSVQVICLLRLNIVQILYNGITFALIYLHTCIHTCREAI